MRSAIGDVDGVYGLHDLHVWPVAGDDASLTARIGITSGSNPQDVRVGAAAMLEMQFGIPHSTIQTETETCGDEAALHA